MMKPVVLLLAAFPLMGFAPYGHSALPHSTAALRELAETDQCTSGLRGPRPFDAKFGDAFGDVVGASALVNAYVDANGRVIAADIVSESDDITGPAAIDLLRAQKFHPASCGSRREPGLYVARFNM
jgi:hypothetical protein